MTKMLATRDLGSLTREVDVVPAWRALGDEINNPGARWGTPVRQIREWITEALRDGDYATASAYSALLGPVVARAPQVGDRVTGTHPLFDWSATGVWESTFGPGEGRAVIRLSGGGSVVLPTSALSRA